MLFYLLLVGKTNRVFNSAMTKAQAQTGLSQSALNAHV